MVQRHRGAQIRFCLLKPLIKLLAVLLFGAMLLGGHLLQETAILFRFLRWWQLAPPPWLACFLSPLACESICVADAPSAVVVAEELLNIWDQRLCAPALLSVELPNALGDVAYDVIAVLARCLVAARAREVSRKEGVERASGGNGGSLRGKFQQAGAASSYIILILAVGRRWAGPCPYCSANHELRHL